MQISRTFLFAPGNHPRKVEKVFGAGADAVILDLEDAVAAPRRSLRRARSWWTALQGERPCRGYIRINALDTEFAFEDLEVVVAPGVDGIVVPKIETAEALATAEWVVERARAQDAACPSAASTCCRSSRRAWASPTCAPSRRRRGARSG